MRQHYFTIMPTNEKGLKYIDKFGSERLRYSSLKEALQHYDEFKRIKIPDIGVAEVICINGAELLKERRAKGLTKDEMVKEYPGDDEETTTEEGTTSGTY